MKQKLEITNCLSGRIKELFERMQDAEFVGIEEIRIRAGQPIIVRKNFTDYFVQQNGRLTHFFADGVSVSYPEIQDTLALLSRYSFYAFQEEMKQGFFTIQGGHRVGIAGKAVLEGGQVKTIKNISALNIRIAHAVYGCANEAMPYIRKDGNIGHTLIVSAPGCGKTTLLRDIIRQLSNGTANHPGVTVGIADERGEIAGCFMGVAQNDVGIRTDVLDCCPKAQGMMMLLRSMSPQVIAVDEIGTAEDFDAIESILYAGVTLVCTVHGNHIADIQNRPYLNRLLASNVFQNIILLSGKGETDRIAEILDKDLRTVYRGKKGAI